jgi:cyclohexyl-isocyanide hydratase
MAIEIGMLLFPDLTQLDLTGPYEVFQRMAGARVHLVWKDRAPVSARGGLSLLPTTTFDECPALDVLFVPGGFDQLALQDDAETLAFLRSQGARAPWVTSVCTGALLLGAAGLLDGYAATTHWAYAELLEAFGARRTEGRVVFDRNRVTGGGVTAGIDFALELVARIEGEAAARAIALQIEYDHEPRGRGGHPRVADEATVSLVRARLGPAVEAQRARLARAPSGTPRDR